MGFSAPDKVKVLHEGKNKQFSAGPVEVFPQRFEHIGDLSAWYGW
jgi:hypothetical protein